MTLAWVAGFLFKAAAAAGAGKLLSPKNDEEEGEAGSSMFASASQGN